MKQSPVVANLAVGFAIAAIAALALLQHHNAMARDAELQLANVQTGLTRLQSAPFEASAAIGGNAERARVLITTTKTLIDRTLARLRASSPPAELMQVAVPLRENYEAVDRIYRLGVSGGYGPRADRVALLAGESAAQIAVLLDAAGSEYHRRAQLAGDESVVGSVAVILALLGAFGFFFSRSNRLRRENAELLAASQHDALTDALTGLGNRRALVVDLTERITVACPDRELLVALFDLDGFKQYNDRYGHPAGDLLLTRLGARLRAAVGDRGVAYRMGGDEFCVLADTSAHGLVSAANLALTDSGHGFEISCSHGTALVPSEASTLSEALHLSDVRMYEDEGEHPAAGRESTDVLLKVLDERSDGLLDHVHDVAELAELTARELGVREPELGRIYPAAELHDIGKSAIPREVLDKAGVLNSGEWEFVRRHTLIGERIVLAAPSLAQVAPMIRSSHERVDGSGYPDGLTGLEIPLGARIIAVCDAYDAMTSKRVYSEPVSNAAALAELQRCARTQFDPEVVEAFCIVAAQRAREGARAESDSALGLPEGDLATGAPGDDAAPSGRSFTRREEDRCAELGSTRGGP